MFHNFFSDQFIFGAPFKSRHPFAQLNSAQIRKLSDGFTTEFHIKGFLLKARAVALGTSREFHLFAFILVLIGSFFAFVFINDLVEFFAANFSVRKSFFFDQVDRAQAVTGLTRTARIIKTKKAWFDFRETKSANRTSGMQRVRRSFAIKSFNDHAAIGH
ncbi:hypothetical protein D3C87_1196160 [compost metagenome]